MPVGLAESARRLSHLLLPVRCAICEGRLAGDPVPFVCRACWSQLKPLTGPACPRCGRPFGSPIAHEFTPALLCGDCYSRPPAFFTAWSSFRYETPLKDAIHLFKYRGKVSLAAPLADLLFVRGIDRLDYDLIMPVPLHPDRLREREFNQALLLAHHAARRLDLPLSYDNLMRTQPTPPQSELSRAARLKNLRRTFAVRHPDTVEGKRILLIDDVLTTGTTVNECAKALRKAGAGPVSVCAVARTV